MNWAQKYRSIKAKKIGENSSDIPLEVIFEIYEQKLADLYNSFNTVIEGTIIKSKLHKLLISKDPRDSFLAEKERVDALILSDNDNELKLIPEGVHYIGILGKVAVRAYRKVYSFNTITERRIRVLKEPYFLLTHDQEDEKKLTWGYIREEESTFFGHEIKILTDSVIEKVLDEVFITT